MRPDQKQTLATRLDATRTHLANLAGGCPRLRQPYPSRGRSRPGAEAEAGAAEERGPEVLNESQLKTLCRCARVIAESAYNRDDGAATVPLVLRAGGLQVSGRLPAEHAARVGRSVCRSLGRAATGGNGRRRRRPAAKKRGARP